MPEQVEAARVGLLAARLPAALDAEQQTDGERKRKPGQDRID